MENKIEKQEEWHHIVTMQDLGNLQRKIHIVYDNEGVDIAFDKACELVAKRVQVKGYRKGKAPKPLVKNFFQEKIKIAASTLLANEGFLHACFEQKIQPLSEPKVENANFDVDGTFSCDIFVEIKPIIIPTGYVGMQIKKPQIDVKALFDSILKETKLQYSSIIEKEEVEEGSTIEVDFEVKYDNNEIIKKSHQFEIYSNMEKPFGGNLLGMKVGETRQEDYIIPYNFKQYAGNQAIIFITLKRVSVRVLPTDEELAKHMQISHEDLIKLIQQRVEVEASNRMRQILEEEIIDKLLEIHDFEIPEKWVNEEVQYIIKQFGVKVDSTEEFYSYAEKMAERNVRRTFILDAIYDAEPTLQITKEELDKLIKQESERTGLSTITIKDRLKKKNVMDSVFGMIRQRKVMEMILNQVQFTEDEFLKKPVLTEISDSF